MHNDRARCRDLNRLTALQGLRAAQGEWALADALTIRTEAEEAEQETGQRLDAAARDYRGMLSSGSFDAQGFHLAGAILTSLEQENEAANERSEQAREHEAAAELRWQRQRHRQDQLGALHTAARRKLARKEEEQAAADAILPSLHRAGRAPA